MRVSKKRCAHCHTWFQPDPRTAAKQLFCSRPECRKESGLQSHRRWWRDNGAACNANRRQKLRTWAGAIHYYPTYRAEHPDYVARDNLRRRKAHEAARRAAKQEMRREISVDEVVGSPPAHPQNAAKQDMSRQISVGKLRDIQAWRPENAVNQDMIVRRVDGILDFLLWKEGAAKQDSTDAAGIPA